MTFFDHLQKRVSFLRKLTYLFESYLSRPKKLKFLLFGGRTNALTNFILTRSKIFMLVRYLHRFRMIQMLVFRLPEKIHITFTLQVHFILLIEKFRSLMIQFFLLISVMIILMRNLSVKSVLTIQCFYIVLS